jgi:hypothetical protein
LDQTEEINARIGEMELNTLSYTDGWYRLRLRGDDLNDSGTITLLKDLMKAAHDRYWEI